MSTEKRSRRAKNNAITGIYLTNPITDNKTDKSGGVKNRNKDNAVYGRETSEIIKL